MQDDADKADEHIMATESIGIQKAGDSVKAMPKGEPGECDFCGDWSGRLVDGACAFCRDRLKLG